ncbi:predicted protein [Naegleria gruberi]|uniref:Predicted protein n=1 Tax=Naegleria gruberi TaxID=5762 RepID=D2VMS8_NAEGR|nr:uncharacterized protein NAEGRDRAFT_70246 [Naegleria gruberi]EFC41787.1 predicted protein [Naegleria gruberi]|eukprot:XP_002674531.1 predicted protein [Naegleria gruberi strain NEG-M]
MITNYSLLMGALLFTIILSGIASLVHAQQMVLSKSRCHAGPFTITFSSTIPISFGTSAKINDGYNTSSTFNSIVGYSKDETSFSFRVGKTSEMGDFFIFNSPHPFAISYTISMDFAMLNSETTTLKIPAFGHERLFTSNLVHTTTNSLTLTNLDSTRHHVKIAYTFAKSEKPNYQSFVLSTTETIPLTIPSQYTSSSNIPFYLYLQCQSSSECNMELKITHVSFTTQQNPTIDSSAPPEAASGTDMQSIFMDELLEAVPSVAYLIGSLIVGCIACACLTCCGVYCLAKRQKKKARVSCIDASTETSFRFVTAFDNKQGEGNNDATNCPTLAFVPCHSFNKSNVMMPSAATQVELPMAADVIMEQQHPQSYPTSLPPPYSSSSNLETLPTNEFSKGELPVEEQHPVVMYQTVNMYQDPKMSFDVDPNFKV